MKTLYEYILEAREYFSPDIPFETVDYVFRTYFANNEPDDHDVDIYNELKQWLPKNIDRDVLIGILGTYWYSKTGMNHTYSKEGVEKFIKFVTSQPLSRIEKILGAGSEGMVFNLGGGRVLKLLFDTDFMGDNERVLMEMKKAVGKKFETLPTVYKVTKNFIIREDCKPGTARVKKFYEVCTSHPGGKALSIECMVAQGREDEIRGLPDNTKEQEDAIEWLLICKEELKSIGYDIRWMCAGTFGDFRPANLGETKDGRIVYFDW